MGKTPSGMGHAPTTARSPEVRPAPVATPIPTRTPSTSKSAGSDGSTSRGAEGTSNGGAGRDLLATGAPRPADNPTASSGTDASAAGKSGSQGDSGKTDAPKNGGDKSGSGGDRTRDTGKSGSPPPGGERPAGGEAPQPTAAEIKGQVDTILGKGQILQDYPHAERLIKDYIGKLEPGEQIAAAQKAHNKLTDSGVLKMLQDVDARIEKLKSQPATAQNADQVVHPLMEWMDTNTGGAARTQAPEATAKSPEAPTPTAAGGSGKGGGDTPPTSNNGGPGNTDGQPPGGSRPPAEGLYDDLATVVGDRVQQAGDARSLGRGDAPAPLTPQEITKQVKAILNGYRVFRRYPHVRELVEQRIHALNFEHQIGVARATGNWTRDPRVRAMFRELDNEHSRSFFEEIGLVPERQRSTPAQRAERVKQSFNSLLESEIGKLDANRREIANLQDRINKATPDEAQAIRLEADPYLREEATKPPLPQDNRDNTERGFEVRDANGRFEKIVKELSDKKLSQRERRKLWALLGLEFLLAGIHASIPPER